VINFIGEQQRACFSITRTGNRIGAMKIAFASKQVDPAVTEGLCHIYLLPGELEIVNLLSPHRQVEKHLTDIGERWRIVSI
jgi:hypothetical protein